MLWTPLEYLLAGVTVGLGCGALLSSSTHFGVPAPGETAVVVQGVLLLLHGLLEGSRLQLYPMYSVFVLTMLWAVLGRSTGAIFGVLTMALATFSLITCFFIPKMIPVGGRGPYDVAVATEHIRTPVASGSSDERGAGVEEPRALELIAEVFYPVDKSCRARLPWFPFTLGRLRRSFVRGRDGSRLVPFALTQAGLVGAAVVVAAARARLSERPALAGEPTESWLMPSTWATPEHAWAIAAALAICCTCFASDLIQGLRRSMFRARYMSRDNAKRLAIFAKMPTWLVMHLGKFESVAFDAGYFYGPDAPCFPVAPPPPHEGKRRVVIFSHGLAGDRSVYAQHAAEIASHGRVAVFLEHNDASATGCIFPGGRVTPYESIPDQKCRTSATNRAFRLAQIRRRVRELKLVREHLSKLEAGRPTDFEACHRLGLGPVISTKRPALLGHSFGSATILQMLSDGEASGESASEYSIAFLMDAWTFPISDQARAFALKTPVVFMTCESFLDDERRVWEAGLMKNAARVVREGANDMALQIRVEKAGHIDYSDCGLFAPFLLRIFRGTGRMDAVTFVDQVTRLLLCSLEVFLPRHPGAGDLGLTKPPRAALEAILGADLADTFPEARIERLCTGRSLPTKDIVRES